MYLEDTIAAIGTPVGEGGIGIIRVSGPDVPAIARRIVRRVNENGDFVSHRFYYGTVVDPESRDTVDEVMAVLMRAPRSFTREDVLEIQCHGGYLVTRRVLDAVLQCGARPAEPGEFTRRAFLNGRIDLVQAEAVIDVIRSKTEAALNLAQHQREGRLSERLKAVQGCLRHSLALVEAFIDFPDDEVDPASRVEIEAKAREASGRIEELLEGFDEGRVLRDGVSVLIAGKPNVGKSSLLNTLLQEKRAIVTSVPGTTRDIIEEVVNVRGLPLRMLDTAGIRETEDVVEQEGVRLTLEKIPQADLILFVLDGSRPFDDDDRMILAALAERRVIVVTNKSDLPVTLRIPGELEGVHTVAISTATGAGIDDLREAVFETFIHGRAIDSREYVALSQTRHRDALVKARGRIAVFFANLAAGNDLEILAVDLRDALDAVGEVTGETTPDDILELIFQRFCIGK
ncbi:tRNA modification GTPase TrmE [Geobacter metallireducens RCH3]|uniref:tRNA modification GTPase MnmE n=1 Tax=Geobacter metallireducens (strain ATCC 53774 / DSM 7210 / GS-15) TaxID=269799 RepID=MNME_GEOMG|nr:tRNA uridine-5-carboxymethylaminomethyl(34) synthesis GTPase MnmE [Geobacter metallireducens]Q39PQ9.1 RecName: Full=tRNA modification GTPase MnmE [Geobacter metallireducens GS-15]ABB33765.1 tRNA (5-carboxymethylaminomethyl-U34) modification GTPase [Geobacter metallireducens GS-15]EHP85745.1 tRNA modification GTPase TrmE [Geobacter metallireducens RCH3]